MFSVSTQSTYASQLKAFGKFCVKYEINPVPLSAWDICRYIAYLADFLCYSSIVQYLNVIRIIHEEAGLPNPIPNNFLVGSTLKGARRVLGSKVSPKSPITPTILKSIYSCLNLRSSLDLHFWSACLTFFFSFSRKANLLPLTVGSFDHKTQVCRCDITFHTGYVLLRFRHTKTNQYGQRELTVPLAHLGGSVMSPLLFLAMCKVLSPPGCGPVFMYKKGPDYVPMTYRVFLDRLKQCLTKLGLDPDCFASHSFRRGGATHALACQVPPDMIKQHGDWASQCYQRYIHPDIQTRIEVTRMMGENL